MARTNNLTNFLTDVASAIKDKKGNQADIQASDFDTEIRNLPSQGTYQQKSTTITQNGTTTITPDSGYDAMDEVTITTAVPLQTRNYSFTQNTTTTLTPEQGYAGFSSVGLTIDVSGGPSADYIILVNQLDYIDFSTTLRFSNITINSNSKIEYKVRPLAHIAWSDILATSSSTHIQMEYDANQVFFILNGSNVLPRYLAVDWSSAHTLTIDNNKFYIDGTLKSSSSNNMNTASWLEINTNSRQVNTRFYYLKLYSSGTLIHNYIPAKVKVYGETTETTCIFDTIAKQIVISL